MSMDKGPGLTRPNERVDMQVHESAGDVSDGYTVSIGYVRALFDFLQLEGVQPQSICSAERLRQWMSLDTNARFGVREWHALMAAAEQHLQDPLLALTMAAHMKPRHAGLLGFMAMTSGNLRDVGSVVVRFHHLLNDVETVQTYQEGQQFVLEIRQLMNSESSRLTLLTLGSWVWYARWLTGREDMRFDILLTQPEPAVVDQHWAFFGGTIRFGQSRNALLGDGVYLTYPVTQQEPLVNRILQQQAAEQMDKLAERSGSFLNKVERLLKGHLDRGDVTLTSLAAELNMSPRTLQSRLEDSGLSFRAVVDRVRQTQAEAYLKDSRLPLIEIALMLGFANQTSFQHAFKRWTGKSPGEFRRLA